MTRPRLQTFNDLAAAIGAEAALRLCGVYGGRRVYVPAAPDADHSIAKIMQPGDFAMLCRAYSGEAIDVPSLDLRQDQTASRVRFLAGRSIASDDIAWVLGISARRVRQIAQE